MASLQASFLFENGKREGVTCVSGKKVKGTRDWRSPMKRLHASMIEEF